MTMMTKAMKGISFLLCVGFLSVATTDVWAKSAAKMLADYEAKLADTETYGTCESANTIIKNYKKNGRDCAKETTEEKSAQSALDNVCNMYKSIKAEYEKCTSGKMDKSKAAAQALATAQKTLSKCLSYQEKLLNEIETELSDCKKAKKAQEQANKADEKADKAAAENDKAQEALEKAEAEYNQATAACENGDQNACNSMKSLYKAYEKAAKKAGKTAKAEKEAFDNAENKNQAAQNAAASTCAANTVWNPFLQACAWFSDTKSESEDKQLLKSLKECLGSDTSRKTIEACLAKKKEEDKQTKELIDDLICDGKGIYDDTTDTCRPYTEEEAAAKKKAEEAKKAAEDAAKEKEEAEKAYSDCVKEKGAEACLEEANRLSDATYNLGKLAPQTDPEGNGSDNSGATNAEIQKMVDAATKPRCSGVSKTGEAHGTFGIFDYLACKITTVVADLRVIVYILAGFGMIAFAYSAIIGKINFKQLANIGIGLFILSMTTGIIEEIVFNDGTSHLQYGDFLPNGNHEQYFQTSTNCSTYRKLCPDVNITADGADAAGKKWSIKDLKSTIQSAKDAVETATQTYKTTKAAVEAGIQAAENIGQAISNGGNIIDMAANIAGNVNAVVANTSLAAATLGSGASTIANDYRDATSSGEQRAYRENLQKEYDILKGKCDTGNCSAYELDALANLESQVQANTLGVDNWLNTTGQDIQNYIQNVGNITGQASAVTTSAQAGQHEGNAIGDVFGSSALGNLLGATMGAANAYTAGSDALNNLQNSGSFDFRSQETKDAEAKAAAEAAAQGGCAAFGGTYNTATGKCTGAKGESIDMATGWATKKNADGSTTSVRKEGNTTTTKVVNADGSTTTTTTNADGSSVTIANKNGHTVVITKDKNGNTTEATVDGMSVEHQECITTRGGKWNAEKKQCEGMTKNADGCQLGWARYNGNCMSEADIKAAKEAEILRKKQEECANETDHEWDGKSCNPKPKEDSAKEDSAGETIKFDNNPNNTANAIQDRTKNCEEGKMWDTVTNSCVSKDAYTDLGTQKGTPFQQAAGICPNGQGKDKNGNCVNCKYGVDSSGKCRACPEGKHITTNSKGEKVCVSDSNNSKGSSSGTQSSSNNKSDNSGTWQNGNSGDANESNNFGAPWRSK